MLGSLLARGYFTEELPPPFTTNAFAAAVEGNPAALPNEFLFDHQPKTRPVIHSVVRPGNLPRRFSLPNPCAAAVTARLVCENWELIETLHRQSHFSMSRPVASDDPARRALIWAHTRQQQALRRVEGRVASRYIVRAIFPSSIRRSTHIRSRGFYKVKSSRNYV